MIREMSTNMNSRIFRVDAVLIRSSRLRNRMVQIMKALVIRMEICGV
jgi:hypothetical protein